MILSFTVLVGLLFVGAFAAEHFAPIRNTKAGQYRGHVRKFNNKHVYIYEGIRYGRAERFEAPVAEKPHDGVYNATRYQFACPQNGIPLAKELDDGKGVGVRISSEDCLFLNVFTPADNGTHRPVMFWIHGGGFETGSSFYIIYDGRVLALQGDVVVVSINYRLGSFGFMYGGGGKYPGNQGLMDQILALKWVQENIEAFGGDPKKVTVFGESAGAMSTGNLILTPEAKGLFHRAILQSGSPNSYIGSESLASSEQKTRSLGEKFKCDNSTLMAIAECLKKLNASQLVDANEGALQNGEQFIPVWNTPFLPHNPWHAVKEGHFNPVDVIQGVNRDEGSIFVVGLFPNLAPESDIKLTKAGATTFIKYLMKVFFPGRDDVTKEISDFYADRFDKLDDPDKFKKAISDVFGDYHLTCPSMLFVQLMAKKRPEGHYYAYHFDKQSVLPLLGCRKWMGVCHAQDIIYVFGVPQILHGSVLDDDEYELSYEMVKAWTRFAHTGHPGTLHKNVHWTPAIDTDGNDSSASLMNLKPHDYRMLPHFYNDICNKFWQPKIEQ